MKYFGVISIALGVLCANQGLAQAADPIPFSPPATNDTVEPEQWHFAASPYFWAAGISGTTGQFGLPPVKMESDFSSILKDIDFSFMGIAEARYERYSLFSDIIYAKVSTGGSTPYGVLSTSVDVTSETFSGFFGGGYSVLQDGKNHLDVIGGARLWYASTEISFKGGLFDGVEKRDGATWVDAVGGIRGQYFLTDNVYLTGWGVVGAGQAKIDWDVAGAIGYQFKDNLSAVAGYRALGVNYNRNGFVYDVVQSGPILGLLYKF
ncbi:hypothetical protein [Mesorhizobium shangrilense]|uniref:Outer membrane protein beta-barrel domain-containing protein n=1 Tax=Mesorhizobium shangrilense TaxID=460060 RepID=A0ABV2DCP7_9HYPH